MRMIAKYYTQITFERLAELTYFPVGEMGKLTDTLNKVSHLILKEQMVHKNLDLSRPLNKHGAAGPMGEQCTEANGYAQQSLPPDPQGTNGAKKFGSLLREVQDLKLKFYDVMIRIGLYDRNSFVQSQRV
uniref:RPN5_C domain-containing protein n=2 Tax=Caenorhabditis tropicalis TaxID=1561998 RepID=A0A1I7T3Q0_9PELO